MSERKKRNSSKINLSISFIFHTALILVLVFFAAKEGMLGKKLKQISVTLAPKEKKPEPPPEKPPEPKPEPPKPAETPKAVANTPKAETPAAPPPAASDTAVAAPPPSVLPRFGFSDGAKEVQTISDPNGIYKGAVEYAFRAHWNRDESIDDSQLAAEVEVSVDKRGRITDTRWVSLSGNARWNATVKNAVAQTKALGKEPPKGFPEKFVIRFDVETKGDAIQLGN